jgi:SAM-dependent methyltransferase
MTEPGNGGRAKEFWEGTEGRWQTTQLEHWLQHPKVQERLNILTTGDPHKDRYCAFVERYFPMPPGRTERTDRVLTLGCGQGEFERGIANYHFATIHDAIDISEHATAEAARLAREAGLNHIHYRATDFNTMELPEAAYDVVFGISSVHHVAQLEGLFEQVARALKPGGFFMLDEFVGPTQFQWTDDQLAIANEELCRLPSDLRRHVRTGATVERIPRHTIAEMNAVDPSEAVRSAEILPLLPKYFDVVEIKGYGGTILHLLMEGITGNFVEEDARSMEWLRSFFALEDRLIAEGRLRHDFAHIVTRKKAK